MEAFNIEKNLNTKATPDDWETWRGNGTCRSVQCLVEALIRLGCIEVPSTNILYITFYGSSDNMQLRVEDNIACLVLTAKDPLTDI